MTDYGVQPTGYVRKPIAIILAELEAAMITEFGPGVIQTSQSPFGQLNGLMADLIAEVDERNLDIYQSYDPDQAEGTRLDTLGKLRLLAKGSLTESQYRKAITNEGQARVDIQDLTNAIRGVEGVTFAQVFVNDTTEVTNEFLDSGSVALVVMGGNDSDIASVMRKYIVPGINTFGNTLIDTNVDGFCRSMSIIRPVVVDVNLSVNIRVTSDRNHCPAPSSEVIKERLKEDWDSSKINGSSVSYYSIRKIVESNNPNVEVVSITGGRDDTTNAINETVNISFLEIANLSTLTVSVTNV